jgi:hypothetical protein
MMRKVTLGRSGLEVSAVGFGGIPIQRLGEAEAVGVVRAALDLGVTFIDTAAGYADSQAKIGKAIAGRREALVLASKSGQATRDGILADVEASRRAMGVDVVDLYQLHGLSSREKWQAVRSPGGALEGLIEARDRGWIGHAGVTSHSLDLSLELVEEERFETIQFPFNLVTSEPAEELIPKSRELGLGFIVMKPLCGGQYDDAELAFRFLNAYPDLVPIPGIERVEEIEQIVPVVASGETLTGEAKARAERIAADLGKQFCRRCGYCMPCPNGVPIQWAMVFESLVKRLPRERVTAFAKRMVEELPQCTDCAACEEKCPYDLPIRVKIKEALEQARRIPVEEG